VTPLRRAWHQETNEGLAGPTTQAADHAAAVGRLITDLSAMLLDVAPDTIDAQVTEVLGRVATFFDLDRSHVAQRAGKDGRLEVTHQWAREDGGDRPSVPDAGLLSMTEEAFRGRLTVIGRPEDLRPEVVTDREFLLRHSPMGAVCLPLTAAGSVIGVLVFGAVACERRWSSDVIEPLRLVARLVGSALTRKQSDLALHAARAENERLRQRLEAEAVDFRAEALTACHVQDIVGQSPALRAVLHRVDQVAGTDVPVLLLGETGTGKELIARALHAGSPRCGRPLITVNCAALPPSLIESELFGHEKGAFTGATQARVGRFELADGSTLFLDEIGDLEPSLQAKLLRTLQDGEVQRLGSSRTRKFDVRIVAATNRDLQATMQEGRFRTDLFYRLSVFPIEIPPLRDRRDDIPLLVWYFIQSRQRGLGRQIKQVPEQSMDRLLAYDWPGNIRELQNVIDRALILSTGPVLRLDEAFSVIPSKRSTPGEPEVEDLQATERRHIRSVLERCRWTVEGRGQAAERLGVNPSTLRNRMKKLGIRRPITKP
jgi:transcriptional regulator with GAF, ATPase, and Fis domain